MGKYRFKKFSVWLLFLAIIPLFMENSLAFDGPTHEYVTKTSLKLICGMEKKYSEFYNNSAKQEVLIYCVKPDEDEAEGGFKNHFYNPLTGRNFMGEKQSALTKFTDHYKNALENYNTQNTFGAWEELGRSMHFLEDLNTPVHTNYEDFWDAGFRLFMHIEFEKRCLAVQSKCICTIEPYTLVYYNNNQNEKIGIECARLSADNFFALNKNISPTDVIAHDSIFNAQRAVIGMLHKFYCEASSIQNSKNAEGGVNNDK